MPHSSVFDLFRKMDTENIILAYKGEINTELLEAVYALMDRHLEEKKTASDKRKKFFHILVESLQNIFHHQVDFFKELNKSDDGKTGFVIRKEGENSYSIITGNYLKNSGIPNLKRRLDEVNALSPEDLKIHYQKSLAGNEFSEKGGAGLGIIEMARKSGHKLKYEFTKVDEEYSFFSLAIIIP